MRGEIREQMELGAGREQSEAVMSGRFLPPQEPP